MNWLTISNLHDYNLAAHCLSIPQPFSSFSFLIYNQSFLFGDNLGTALSDSPKITHAHKRIHFWISMYGREKEWFTIYTL